jgi:hypothetical protein
VSEIEGRAEAHAPGAEYEHFHWGGLYGEYRRQATGQAPKPLSPMACRLLPVAYCLSPVAYFMYPSIAERNVFTSIGFEM